MEEKFFLLYLIINTAGEFFFESLAIVLIETQIKLYQFIIKEISS
jgi:hypothetical protein